MSTSRQTMVHTYTTWWRRKWNGEQPTGTLPDSPAAPPTDAADVRADLRVALARLPCRQRAVVVLRFYEDLSVAEDAEATVGDRPARRVRPGRLIALRFPGGTPTERVVVREVGTPVRGETLAFERYAASS